MRAVARFVPFLYCVAFTACGGHTHDDGDHPDAGAGGASSSGGSPSGAGAPGSSGGAPNHAGSSSSGGTRPGTGGAPPSTTPCTDVLPEGTACSQSGARCVGVCSGSWQAESTCTGGKWRFTRTVACAPNASECRNSFGGGELTPCCGDTKPDCTGKPDGYPGFGCTPGQDSFCSCTCSTGQWVCGC